MLFCPYCSNNLTIGDSENSSENAWVCPTCPYKWNITNQISMRTHLKRKEVDDVMGGKEAWVNVDKTSATCPKCDHRMAYFRQLQIRSADEPMTTFYKCEECAHQWREN
ncbi:DNA-directed RNA polymerase III subunit RPC10 [Saitozyma sp. JCM 24511]|uniref:DNA-directed RNA polymerase subunit n=1 Tax=Saitozyma podzolica TaxID=1890683 RepID=A0A427XTW1_9TREE|nr:RNA polymerase III C11 subunit [Saitozyma podzolica]GFZ50800.1 DNA-directed RNA polymerase III subunit RPC10 [Saitozyma sp. JCM 24511]